MAERSARKVGPTTLFSWTRQFRQLGDSFKRDGKGVREREWILSEKDLEMDLINWLKAQKRVTTKNSHVFVNTVLLAREGGLLLLAKYALTLPISTTTVNAWMRKLGCTFDRVKQFYYTDGHGRPDVKRDRGDYVRR